MKEKKYLVFVFKVFNGISEDKTMLIDDVQIELIGTDLKEEEKRALKLTGRKLARSLFIIEKF